MLLMWVVYRHLAWNPWLISDLNILLTPLRKLTHFNHFLPTDNLTSSRTNDQQPMQRATNLEIFLNFALQNRTTIVGRNHIPIRNVLLTPRPFSPMNTMKSAWLDICHHMAIVTDCSQAYFIANWPFIYPDSRIPRPSKRTNFDPFSKITKLPWNVDPLRLPPLGC